MNLRMATGVVLMVVGLFVMLENVVYSLRFGPAAWPVVQWTLPGAIVVALSGAAVHWLGERAWREDE